MPVANWRNDMINSAHDVRLEKCRLKEICTSVVVARLLKGHDDSHNNSMVILLT